MTEQLQSIEAEARLAVAEATTTDALNKIETDFLGRNGRLTGLLRTIGSLPNDQEAALWRRVERCEGTAH